VHPEELQARMAAGTAPVVIDVRSRADFDHAHVPGATHVPFWRFLVFTPPAARAGTPLVLYCGHGPRAAIARGILRWRGISRVELLAGHWAAWRRAGRPSA
jgi:hydroxyacylglutathione hydrolase